MLSCSACQALFLHWSLSFLVSSDSACFFLLASCCLRSFVGLSFTCPSLLRRASAASLKRCGLRSSKQGPDDQHGASKSASKGFQVLKLLPVFFPFPFPAWTRPVRSSDGQASVSLIENMACPTVSAKLFSQCDAAMDMPTKVLPH